MKTTKLSLANIQGKLSRNEMKSISAGFNPGCGNEGDICLVKAVLNSPGSCCSGLTCVGGSGYPDNAGKCIFGAI